MLGDFLNLKKSKKLNLPPASLFFPVIWFTNRCNLRCRMCDQWRTPESLISKELSILDWQKFVDSAKRLNSVVIVITGGEPILRGDIFQLVSYIKKRGISSHICSNGTLLNLETVERLSSAGLDSISISLDSFDSKIHNQLRGMDCFQNAIKGIQLLKQNAPGIKVGINCVITRLNFRGIYKMILLAEELGVDQIRFDPVHTNLMHRKMSSSAFEDLLFSPEEMRELEFEIDRLIKFSSQTRISTNSSLFLNGIKDYFRGRTRNLPCYAGYISCAIDSFGNVSPCDNFDGVENIKDKPLEEIWYSESFQSLRRLVEDCRESCWDTTHGELNIRCRLRYLFLNFPQLIKEVNFYFSKSSRIDKFSNEV